MVSTERSIPEQNIGNRPGIRWIANQIQQYPDANGTIKIKKPDG